MPTSEAFRVEPSGKYFAIYWGPTLICTEWSTREGAQLHCDLLDALREWHDGDVLSTLAVEIAWRAFRDARNKGRWGE